MSKDEANGFLEKARYVGEESVQLDNDAARFKAAASRVVQDGKTVAQRLGRQSLNLAGNASNRIKDDPIRSAAVTFVIGLSVGALVGRLLGRQQSH